MNELFEALTTRVVNLERKLGAQATFGTSGNFTAGAIPFGGTGGNLVSDSSNFFFDNTLDRLYLGTNSISAGNAVLILNGTNASVNGPHIQAHTGADIYPLIQLLAFQHDNLNLSFDAYYDGSWRSSDVGSNYQIRKLGDLFSIFNANAVAAGSVITWVEQLRLNNSGSLAHFVTSALTASAGINAQFFSRSTATPAAGFGGDYQWLADSASVADRNTLTIRGAWATATDASRKARATFFIYDTAVRTAIILEASGSAPLIGVLGAAAVARQTVTGSRGGNAALASLLTAMANFGWITDSTTA